MKAWLEYNRCRPPTAAILYWSQRELEHATKTLEKFQSISLLSLNSLSVRRQRSWHLGNLMEESHFGPQSHFFQRFLHLSLKYFPKILRVTKHDQCSVDGDITVIVQVCPELWCSQTKGAAKLGLRMNANGSLGDLLTNQVNDQRFHLLPFSIRETLISVTINLSAHEMWHNQPKTETMKN